MPWFAWLRRCFEREVLDGAEVRQIIEGIPLPPRAAVAKPK